jgi:endonuclease/exonuclease/phosphatase (EEP) superfamily protein YafD
VIARKFWLIAASKLLFGIGLVGFSLPLWVSLFDNWMIRISWALDLMAHWQIVYLSAATLGIAGLAIFRSINALVLLPVLCAPYLTASPSASEGSNSDLTIANANVEFTNGDAVPLLQWVAKVEPDILVTPEVTPEYATQVEKRNVFPFRLIRFHENAFGIAIWSKYPIKSYTIHKSETNVERIDAVIEISGRPVDIVAFHPRPPFNPFFHKVRNSDLTDVTFQLSDSGRPGIIVGDFNASPWSSAFTGLSDLGFKRTTTLWPTWQSRWKGWFGIPIDHIVVSRHWHSVASDVGPDIGSDHFPVVATLSLNSSADDNARKPR